MVDWDEGVGAETLTWDGASFGNCGALGFGKAHAKVVLYMAERTCSSRII